MKTHTITIDLTPEGINKTRWIAPALSLASTGAFAYWLSGRFGVWMAVTLTILIFFHELGHVIALYQRGYGIKWPYFIPFVGAVISSPHLRSRHVEAYVGIGGPVLGTLAVIGCLAVALFVRNYEFWLCAALFGLFVNILNMIPLSPLDGGRITQAVSPYLKWVGVAMLIGVLMLFPHPFNFAMVGFILLNAYFTNSKDTRSQLSASKRINWMAAWSALLLVQVLTIACILPHISSKSLSKYGLTVTKVEKPN